jgi:GH25 family lysozyme M1 (1,4-beta-N-acetylmuramidase)
MTETPARARPPAQARTVVLRLITVAMVGILGLATIGILSPGQSVAGQRAGMQAGVTAAGEGCRPGPTPTPKPTKDPNATPTPKPTGPTPTPWPTPPGITGLDVSHWNGYPSFPKLYGWGMRFVFSKATQGTSFIDQTYERHTREARGAGLEVGAYHFYDYTMDGVAQARHFLDRVRATSGLNKLLPLVVDVECLRTIGISYHAPATQQLHAMLDEIYAQTGRYPMIYTSRLMWKAVLGAPSDFGEYPLWVACWKCNTIYMPNGWKSWLFWQVGGYRFPGIGALDGNVFSSTKGAKLRALRQRAVRIAKGAAYATSQQTTVDLVGVDGKDVRVALGNGPFGEWQPYQKRLPFELAPNEGPQTARVQLRSFRGVRSPVFSDDIILETQPPKITELALSLTQGGRAAASGARVPATARMSASDVGSGVAASVVEATCGNRIQSSDGGASGKAQVAAQLGLEGCSVKGTASDVAGHSVEKTVGPLSIGVHDIRSSDTRVALRGAWSDVEGTKAIGKTLVRATAAGPSAKLRFKGAQVALVAQRGPSGGQAEVVLDGAVVATVDLYAATTSARRLVFVSDVQPGAHVIVVRSLGKGQAASQGTAVELDAFVVLDRTR